MNSDEYMRYYVNPSMSELADAVLVPCESGTGVYGFQINGIPKESRCNHPMANTYALVYNMFVRNSRPTLQDLPQYLQQRSFSEPPDIPSIYRYAILFLMLIRHNYVKGDTISVDCHENQSALILATEIINYYAELFCRLSGKPFTKLNVNNVTGALAISLCRKAQVYVTDVTTPLSAARELWFGDKIDYRLTQAHLQDVQELLSCVSNYHRFKPGQYEALCNLIAANEHGVCIMPTGAGKSLIFYLASFLQPLPLFVIAPTDILIKDQIRNLEKFHRIDNVAHLSLTGPDCFADWEVHNSLNYITPTTFQDRTLLQKFRSLNNGTKRVGMMDVKIVAGALVSYIILDEIHCLSNWGHDFRPEYLMLSKYLYKFFGKIPLWGFTATANFTVVEDVQKQLGIFSDRFYSPVSFDRYNVSYCYRAYDTEEQMLMGLTDFATECMANNMRTVIFTKTDEASLKVAEAIGSEADVYTKREQGSYEQFVSGQRNVLIANDELGVGINFPDVRCVIHYGLPLSKNEYVQQIGRAGRANEEVKSFVLYLQPNAGNVPQGLLDRSTPIAKLPALLENCTNDYCDVYKKLSNGAVSQDVLCDNLMQLYNRFVQLDKSLFVERFDKQVMNIAKQHLYMLYLVGYISDWYTYKMADDNSGIEIMINIISTDAESFRAQPAKMLARMKYRLNAYFDFMQEGPEQLQAVVAAGSAEELIELFVSWYYGKYLYHHSEQFLDLFEFIQTNQNSTDDAITDSIKDYFILPFSKLQDEEELYNSLTLTEIYDKAQSDMSKRSITNLERINTNRYSKNIDFALFFGNLRLHNLFEADRLLRIIHADTEDERSFMKEKLGEIYGKAQPEIRIQVVNFIENNAGYFHTTFSRFVQELYINRPKDVVYYGIVAKQINSRFAKMRRIK